MIAVRLFLGVTIAAPLAAGLSGDGVLPLVARAQQTERATLGVMRRDGVILPFAAYDGDWSTPWPVNIRSLEIPITLDGVPKKWWGGELPGAWVLWPPAGQSSVRVSPSTPVVVPIGSEKRLGIRTDYRSREQPPPPFELPYPKDGLAVAGDVTVESISAVSRLIPRWRELTASLMEDINAAEQKAIDRIRGNTRWTHPFSRDRRRTVPAELEAWYTSTLEQPGFAVSYIEAAKKYPPGEEDEGCGLETFVSGWVHTNNREPKPRTELAARVTYCDREGVSYMLPLGRLRVKSRTHWVYQMSGWEHEWYVVVEATPGRVKFVSEYFAGGWSRFLGPIRF